MELRREKKEVKHIRKWVFLISSLFLSLTLASDYKRAEEFYLLSGKIQEENIKREVFKIRTREESLLIIDYEHSLYHTPQKEVYTIQNGILILREVKFGKLEAVYYYNPNPPGKLYRDAHLWKFLPAKPYIFPLLKIRIPYTVYFTIQLNDSIIWTAQDKDRGGLLVVAITGGGKR